MKKAYLLLLILSLIGVADAGYLTLEHYAKLTPPCFVNPIFADCGKVLTSQYAVFFQIPLSLWGVFYYVIIMATTTLALISAKKRWIHSLSFFSTIGLSVSLYLVYLQIFILKAFCFYCMISAISSLLIFIIVYFLILKTR